MAGNTQLQQKEDGELRKSTRARNNVAKQRRRAKIPPCPINKLNIEIFKAADALKTPTQDPNIQISSKPNYEPWNKYHQLNPFRKPDQISINSNTSESQASVSASSVGPKTWAQHNSIQSVLTALVLPTQQTDYFRSKP